MSFALGMSHHSRLMISLPMPRTRICLLHKCFCNFPALYSKFHALTIKYIRFLHIRMLLFRPIMSRFCTAPDSIVRTSSLEDALPSRIALQCSILCVKVAQESIELIYSHVTSEGSANRLPAWWYNVLCKLPPQYILIYPPPSPFIPLLGAYL
jgi:hypothetical protein